MARRRFLSGAAVSAAVTASALESPREGALDGGRLVHPTFLDLQVNGCAGVDFNDPSTSGEPVLEAPSSSKPKSS
jgi:N-acetylglucosamine-6-phosphate deacetylase